MAPWKSEIVIPVAVVSPLSVVSFSALLPGKSFLVYQLERWSEGKEENKEGLIRKILWETKKSSTVMARTTRFYQLSTEGPNCTSMIPGQIKSWLQCGQQIASQILLQCESQLQDESQFQDGPQQCESQLQDESQFQDGPQHSCRMDHNNMNQLY